MLGKVETIDGVKQITNLTSEVVALSLDDVYPIGFVYTQFPAKKSPAELFPNFTWTELDYDGAFFRASGTNANPFITANDTLTPQAQGTKPGSLDYSTQITSSLNCWWTHSTASAANDYFGGIIGSIGDYCAGNSGGWHGRDWIQVNIDFSHSHTVTLSSTDPETRPVNYTTKIWKRTA